MSTPSRPRVARYAWGVLVIAVLAIAAGYGWVAWSKGGAGDGLYSRQWQPDAAFGYWSPVRFYRYDGAMSGRYEGPQCVECHNALTPASSRRASRHAARKMETVYCDSCHGNDSPIASARPHRAAAATPNVTHNSRTSAASASPATRWPPSGRSTRPISSTSPRPR
jgi:hypothetical protein